MSSLGHKRQRLHRIVSPEDFFIIIFIYFLKYFFKEVTIFTLPHLKCIRLVSVHPCINKGMQIELTKKNSDKKADDHRRD